MGRHFKTLRSPLWQEPSLLPRHSLSLGAQPPDVTRAGALCHHYRFGFSMPRSSRRFDVAVVGAGICGLAHALAAGRRGKRVVVVDRDDEANGASIRNFGFVTITGQQAGECWRRARRSRDVWAEVAEAAGIPVVQRGLLVIARRPEARAVLEQFLATDMGAECRLVEAGDIGSYGTGLRSESFSGALYSPRGFAWSRARRSPNWRPTWPSATTSPSCARRPFTPPRPATRDQSRGHRGGGRRRLPGRRFPHAARRIGSPPTA